MMRNFPVKQLVSAVSLLVAASGCSDRQGGESTAEGGQAVAAVESLYRLSWADTISLEENSAVINVDPNVTMDDKGNFVVADRKEAQARVYTPAGRLLAYYGRRGQGPGEFRAPISSMRLSSGEILVVDADARAASFPPEGGQASRAFRIPLKYVYEAELVDDSLLLVVGRGSGTQADASLLHLYDLATMSLVRRFFPPPPAVRGQPSESSLGFASAAVRGDTVAAVHSLSDTVYLFSLEGKPLGRLPIRTPHFRAVRDPLPEPGSDFSDVTRWASTVSMVSNVVWVSNGDVLVQYQDRDGPEIKWHLARITSGGRVVFSAENTPRLLAASESGGLFYFLAPDAEAPNKWISASFRR